mgnify:CR=1 FL=1
MRTRRAPPEAAQPEAGWLRAASGERASGALRMRVEKHEHVRTGTREDGHTSYATCSAESEFTRKLPGHTDARARSGTHTDARALWDTRVSRQSAASVCPCAAYTATRASTLARESAPPRAVMLPSRSPTRRPLLGLDEASLPGVASVRPPSTERRGSRRARATVRRGWERQVGKCLTGEWLWSCA